MGPTDWIMDMNRESKRISDSIRRDNKNPSERHERKEAFRDKKYGPKPKRLGK